tara:strand:+ start:463 stop:918 length:456 start_codon:yes stop_codon:yes gene_type:complete
MQIQNPIYFLLDHYYFVKYIEKRKSLKHKSINFYISNTYKRSASNRKFKTIRPVFNAMSSLYLKRNVVQMTEQEMEKILDDIDEEYQIIPRKFHLETYYKEYPMQADDYKSLMKFNFYDLLIFEYISHKDRNIVFNKMVAKDKELRNCDFF